MDAIPAARYARLTLDLALDALEGMRFRGDWRLLVLNGYENRSFIKSGSWLPRSVHHLRGRPDVGEIDSDVGACMDTLEGGMHQADELEPAQALVAEGGNGMDLFRGVEVDAGRAFQGSLGGDALDLRVAEILQQIGRAHV